MFFYEFKSGHLIKAVSLSGRILTIYNAKERSLELNIIYEEHKNQLKLEQPAYHGEFLHRLAHNQFLGDKNKIPHQHATINLPNTEEVITNFFNAIEAYQNNANKRLEGKNSLAKTLDNVRIKKGHSRLPPEAQEIIDTYDTQGLIIDSQEKEDFFAKLKAYLNNPKTKIIKNISVIAHTCITTGQVDCNFGISHFDFMNNLTALHNVLLETETTVSNNDSNTTALQKKLTKIVSEIKLSPHYQKLDESSKNWIKLSETIIAASSTSYINIFTNTSLTAYNDEDKDKDKNSAHAPRVNSTMKCNSFKIQ